MFKEVKFQKDFFGDAIKELFWFLEKRFSEQFLKEPLFLSVKNILII